MYIQKISAICFFVSVKKICTYSPYIRLCNTRDPWMWGNFGPQEYNLNKLCKGLLPSIKALGPVISEEFFLCFPYLPFVNQVTPGTPGTRGII